MLSVTINPVAMLRKSSKAKSQVVRACKASIFVQPHGVEELKISVNKVPKSYEVHKSSEHTTRIIICHSTESNEGNHLRSNKCKVMMTSLETSFAPTLDLRE